jgi:replicative DNA helicase
MRIALPRTLSGPAEETMGDEELALLGHLIGDGCTLPTHAIQSTSKDPDLAETVADLARDVFGDRIRPRVRPERNWFQTYLPAARPLTHGVRNPVAEWLDELGVFGLRSWEKRVPERVFAQPAASIAVFLHHLWSTDGCIWARSERDYPVVRYDSSSERLSREVCSLLLRLGITASLRRVSMGEKGRATHRVLVTGRPDLERFLTTVGGFGDQRARESTGIRARVANWRPNTNRDVLPAEPWTSLVKPAMAAADVTTRRLQAELGTEYCGSTLYRSGLGRDRAARVAEIVGSDELRNLATSDVYWDGIVSIEPDGEDEVYDLTVDGLHNFVAEDMAVHNSIEQDADLVGFIYRDEYYNEESDQQGLAEVILAKHRNGPTDALKLSFLKRYAKFADLAAT